MRIGDGSSGLCFDRPSVRIISQVSRLPHSTKLSRLFPCASATFPNCLQPPWSFRWKLLLILTFKLRLLASRLPLVWILWNECRFCPDLRFPARLGWKRVQGTPSTGRRRAKQIRFKLYAVQKYLDKFCSVSFGGKFKKTKRFYCSGNKGVYCAFTFGVDTLKLDTTWQSRQTSGHFAFFLA